MTVIETKNLTKVFRVGFQGRKVTALSGLNLNVFQGEIFGFLGPNGAGKTTTIKILMGLIYPTSGNALLFDRPVGETKIKERVGFLPEQPYFYDYLTAAEFLTFYGRLFGIPGGDLRSRMDALLPMVGLSHARDMQLRKFSKGMLQRVGIAQALINYPDLVVLDEPMSGLDPVGRKEVRDMILRLRDEGKTVFFSSHIIPDVELICNRVGILLKGTLVKVGKLHEILESRVKYVEMVAQGGEKSLPGSLRQMGASVYEASDQMSIRIPDESQIDGVLDRIREAKGKIVSVIPQKETLEEHFMKLAG
jgi:ABC-2 type transport system ATP-binding protein